MNKEKKVIFRCDASAVLGAGHAMRCLTLADCFKDKGWRCGFICSDETMRVMPILQDCGHDIFNLDAHPEKADWLIVDHYGLNADYETQARRWADHIGVISDLPDRSHDCDILLDQTYGRQEKEYKALVPDHCQILTGTDYALLRPQFSELREIAEDKRRQSAGRVKNILISLGNANLYNITGTVLDAFKKYDEVSIDLNVVLGAQASELDSVKRVINEINAGDVHSVMLHQDVSNMAQMMLDADLAIGAGGTTSWERCCVGLPTLLIELADNQKDVVKALAKQGSVISLGGYDKFNVDGFIQQLKELLKYVDTVFDMSQKAFEVCDGRGADRVLQQVEKLWNNM